MLVKDKYSYPHTIDLRTHSRWRSKCRFKYAQGRKDQRYRRKRVEANGLNRHWKVEGDEKRTRRILLSRLDVLTLEKAPNLVEEQIRQWVFSNWELISSS